MSGGAAMQTSPTQRFPFNEPQFPSNQSLGNMYGQQQQQQMFQQQNRSNLLQRQLSMPGTGGRV